MAARCSCVGFVLPLSQSDMDGGFTPREIAAAFWESLARSLASLNLFTARLLSIMC